MDLLWIYAVENLNFLQRLVEFSHIEFQKDVWNDL
jgi:hypothetical protein